MEQFRRLTRELPETKKTAEEALKKVETKNAVEGATDTMRQRAEEEDKGGSSSSAPYSNRVEVTKNQGEEDHRGKVSKKVNDVDLQLKPRFIGSFTELCKAFISQYVCNRRPRKDVTILFSTKQNVGESLKSYMTKFTGEMSTLEECDSHTASLAFREGVLPGTKMHMSLMETPPLDMRKVMARANGIIRLEEEELIQSKQATATIVASSAGITTKDLSGY
ncbi:unnamed protein product [Malus baccata var. baccata]